MPYVISKTGEQWCVYKEDDQGQPTGETLGCHDSEEQAKAQLAALYAAMENESMSDSEERKEREDYPWDECIADQMEKYGDEEKAQKICGSIKAKYGGGSMKKPSEDEMREILKELKIEPIKKQAMPREALQYRSLMAIAQRAADVPPKAPIRFVASTEGVKRDGLDLRAADWEVTRFMQNPIVSWAHDYNRPPIGRAAVAFEGRDMVADVQFDDGDPFAQDIERKVRAGFINAVSVGWSDMADGKRDLVDIAVCAVPVDPQALAISRAYEEPDGLRYGVVISRKNFGDLEQAHKLIGRVLARAKHEPDEEEDDDEAEERKSKRGLVSALEDIDRRIGTLIEVRNG